MLKPYEIPNWRDPDWHRWDVDTRRTWQSDALVKTIREQVFPFSRHYARVFHDIGLSPDDIQSVDDLTKLPLTSKQDLLSTPDSPNRAWDYVLLPERMRDYLAMSATERAKMFHGFSDTERAGFEELIWEYFPVHANHTTGRSAAPTPVWYTRRDLYDHAEKIRRCLAVTRHDPLGKMLVLWPFTAVSHQAFWCMPIYGLGVGAQIVHSGGGKAAGTALLLEMARQHRPQTLCLMPGYAFHFLRQAEQAGVPFDGLRTVYIGGEKCTNEMRQRLHEGLVKLGANPLDLHIVVSYGATEFRGAAQECCTGPGDFSSSWYHTSPDMEIYEIVDPESGEPVPEGETGEVVYTCLDGRGTVLLRYRTGDLAVEGMTSQPCPHCGSTVPRISNELRRVSNMKDLRLTKLKGSLIDLGAFSPLLRSIDSIEEFQVELCKRDNDPFGVDELVIHVASSTDADHEQVTTVIRSAIEAATEVTPNRVEFHPLSTLLEMVGMETSLKDVRLVDHRPEDSRI